MKKNKIKNKKGWYKFYADMGPGHQSHEETYVHFSDKISMEQLKLCLEDWANEFWYADSVIAHCKKIKRPPKNWIICKLNHKKAYIQDLKESIQFYENELDKYK